MSARLFPLPRCPPLTFAGAGTALVFAHDDVRNYNYDSAATPARERTDSAIVAVLGMNASSSAGL
jgi:hypothetical protein